MSSFDIAKRLCDDVQQNITYFSQIPWTAHLLSRPEYETAPIWVRVPKPTGEDSFFGGIIKTPDTVPHMLCLRRRKLETLGTRSRTENPEDPDVMFLFTLSRAGLQGHPATAHGGFLNVLFDEMMGQTMTCHYPPTENGGYFTSGGTLYTANLNVNFRAPMALPGTYLYRGWMTRQERRKSWVEGEMVDVEGGGRVLTEGTSLWVTVGKEIEMPGRGERSKI